MKKRMFFMLLAVFGFIVLIGGFKFFQIKAAMAQGANYQPPPEAVTTIVVKQEDWNATLNAIGSVAAVNGVTVSADLPGLVSEIAFASGQSVNKGDVLVRLDTKQERAQLVAAQSQRDLSKLALDRTQGLFAKGISAQQALDEAAAEHKQAEARVGEIAATIERKTIRAPFSGVLGIRQINLGQYLTGGAPVVPLQSLDPIYVNFSVPQQEVSRMGVVGEVRVAAEGSSGTADAQFTGKITAVDSVVNEATRNVQVQAT